MKRLRREASGGRCASRSAAAAVLALATVVATAVWAQAVQYSRDPGAVVARYQELPGEIAEADRGRSVTVYGDGRVLVHHPHYTRSAGDYTTRLDAAELDALVGALVAEGVLTFDAAATRTATREAAAGARGADDRAAADLDVVVSDVDLTVLELHANGVAKTVRWSGLRGDAARHPTVGPLQGLARAEREMRALLERADLQKVE